MNVIGVLKALIQLIELVPSAIELIEKLIAIIHGHPQGVVAGVAAAKETLDRHEASEIDPKLQSKIGNAPDLVGMD